MTCRLVRWSCSVASSSSPVASLGRRFWVSASTTSKTREPCRSSRRRSVVQQTMSSSSTTNGNLAAESKPQEEKMMVSDGQTVEKKAQNDKLGPPPSSSSPTTTTTTITDNPCWGGTGACGLADLLQMVQKQTHILHESADFVALYKPPDLRMDGETKATVHKLLTVWYPPPSLLERVRQEQEEQEKQQRQGQGGEQEQQQNTTTNDSDNNKNVDQTLLVQILEQDYHNHGAHPDNELRPVHQLDYATSGVLLTARSRQAANFARVAFDQRRIHKSYLALTQGSMTKQLLRRQNDNNDMDWPCLESQEQVRRIFAAMEQRYRKQQQKEHKRNNKNKTFQGYQPPASLFQQWQQQQKQQALQKQKQEQNDNHDDNHDKKKKRHKKSNHPVLTEEQWRNVWDQLQDDDDDDDDSDNNKNDNYNDTESKEQRDLPFTFDMNWKQIKEMGQAHRFQRAAKVYNEYLLEHRKKENNQNNNAPSKNTNKNAPFQPGNQNNHDNAPSLPMVFRVQDSNSFFICASIAEVPNRFAVTLDPQERIPDYLPRPPPSTVYCNKDRANKDNGNDDDGVALNFKPSLTQCTILKEYDNDNNATTSSSSNGNATSTTKVALTPWSGRRHQLRIHMALLGHVIVGDQTYDETRRRGASHRMCLHAHKLRVPLPNWEGDKKNGGKRKREMESEQEVEYLDLEAPDPF